MHDATQKQNQKYTVSLGFVCCICFCLLCTLPAFASAATPTIARVQIDGANDIYMWPYACAENNITFDISDAVAIDVIFVGQNRDDTAEFIKKLGMNDLVLFASNTHAYRGDSLNTMNWVKNTNLVQNNGTLGMNGRFHLDLFEGTYSKQLGKNWCFGVMHYDTVGPKEGFPWFWHWLEKDALNKGVQFLRNNLPRNQRTGTVNLGNGNNYFFDGNTLVVFL